MKLRMVMAFAVAVLLCASVSNVYAQEEVSIGPTLEKSDFKPELPKPFPTREFLTSIKELLPDNLGVVNGPKFWSAEELHELCQKPFVIATEKIVEPQILINYNCFIFMKGDVKRVTVSAMKQAGMEVIEYGGMRVKIPAGSTIMLINGKFYDNLPRNLSSPAVKNNGTCVSDPESGISTCSMVEMDKPVCRVTEYRDANMTVVDKLLSGVPLASCEAYVEGEGTVSGDVCFVKALGASGKINIDCMRRFGLDASAGEYDIFLSDADGFVMANGGSNIYVGNGVQLLFIDNSKGSAKVIKPQDSMPNMRIISAEGGF